MSQSNTFLYGRSGREGGSHSQYILRSSCGVIGKKIPNFILYKIRSHLKFL